MTLFDDGCITTFRYLVTSDQWDDGYDLWSRIYEYPWAMSQLPQRIAPRIHNTAWGWDIGNVRFRTHLDAIGCCIHSDRESQHPTLKTTLYDMTEHQAGWDKTFDAVLCISTLEHLSPEDRPVALANLWAQVARGGRLILTCDVPTVTEEELTKLFGYRPLSPGIRISGERSAKPNMDRHYLNVVAACVEKL